MIEFRGVTKQFPDGTVAVRDVDIVIPPHKTTVFVGSSGSGKTTLLRMINRMVDPSGGQVLIDGTDVATVDPVRLRRGIGYVMQNSGLLPHRKVIDNVATVPMLRGTKKREAHAHALELLDTVGLDRSLADRYPSQLSGGQQQRVGVARGLAVDPNILLMDEPFGAVDPIVRAELQQELLRLQGELGKTVVFVTHDIEEAVRMGDRIAILRQGGVLEQYDTPAQVLGRPASPFVASFVGADRGLKRLTVTPIDLEMLEPCPAVLDGFPTVAASGTLNDALAEMLQHDRADVAVVDGGRCVGVLTLPALHAAARRSVDASADGGRAAEVREERVGNGD
jgi:osmoprotectant transport system ATP-binding protein